MALLLNRRFIKNSIVTSEKNWPHCLDSTLAKKKSVKQFSDVASVVPRRIFVLVIFFLPVSVFSTVENGECQFRPRVSTFLQRKNNDVLLFTLAYLFNKELLELYTKNQIIYVLELENQISPSHLRCSDPVQIMGYWEQSRQPPDIQVSIQSLMETSITRFIQ